MKANSEQDALSSSATTADGHEEKRHPDIVIEDASIEDAPFVAWTVLTALDLDTDNLARAVTACSDRETLYSWTNSIVAKIDGEVVGCLIAYDGKRYEQMRRLTWPMIWPHPDTEYFDQVAIETVAGEYYLDSMAILPNYRGLEIGHRLMLHAIAKGRTMGLKRATLIVDVNKPHLKAYYRSIGFREVGKLEFFGHYYDKMACE